MRLIDGGELDRHISRMRKLYFRRRCQLLERLEKAFPGQVTVYGEAAGMHLVAGFRDVVFSPELVRRIRDKGVYLVPVEDHSAVKGSHRSEVILGYAQLKPEEMERGLAVLKRCLAGN
ncbi:HTH-type transcriptional regulatory protein GabR [bioreactor metagenome]|uniref:HTH-type transcriptional regulatory protein GabR n=1 Tax=bioreactor metagenome TaxID=1076179 RepID=A0A645IEZ2_9ZZZZ